MGRSRLKVLYISGTRADYELMRPVLRKLANDPSVDLGILVTGMHLRHAYGYTFKEILEDRFKVVAKLDTLHRQDTVAAMSYSLGVTLAKMSQVFAKSKPDVVLLLGDRDEQLAAAVAAAHMNIGVAQVHAGERTGSIDECNRHAISRYAHLLFTATPDAAKRLKRFGEPRYRIHCVGAPALDHLLKMKPLSRQQLSQQLKLPMLKKPYVVLLQHAVTHEASQAAKQINETLAAIKAAKIPCVALKPNADAGSGAILKSLQAAAKRGEIELVTHLHQALYAQLLKNAKMLIGNSSGGIIEAGALRIAAINIGNRQHLRFHGKNVLDVGYDRRQIYRAMQRILHGKVRVGQRERTLYGDGKAAVRILAAIKRFAWNDLKTLSKVLEY